MIKQIDKFLRKIVRGLANFEIEGIDDYDYDIKVPFLFISGILGAFSLVLLAIGIQDSNSPLLHFWPVLLIVGEINFFFILRYVKRKEVDMPLWVYTIYFKTCSLFMALPVIILFSGPIYLIYYLIKNIRNIIPWIMQISKAIFGWFVSNWILFAVIGGIAVYLGINYLIAKRAQKK